MYLKKDLSAGIMETILNYLYLCRIVKALVETAPAPFYDSTLQAESPCKHLGSVLRTHIDRVF